MATVNRPPDTACWKHLATWIVLLSCLIHSSRSATVSEVTPRVGSLGGETRLTIYGSGFSADQFSQDDDENTGNKVYLVSGSGTRLQCPVHKDGCTEIQIMCYTPERMNPEAYYIRVVVDGVVVPDGFLCNGNPVSSRCTYTPKDANTPMLRSISPQSATPGSIITVDGRIVTDRYGSNIATASNGRTVKLLRTYVGPNDCELKNGDTFYGLSVGEDSDDGTLVCKLKGTSVGFYNTSTIVDSPFGRSKAQHDILRVSANDDIFTLQIFTEITAVSPQAASPTGGMTVMISGDYFDNRAPYTALRAYVGDTVCDITNVVIDEYVECTVAADPGYTDSKFPGNRGVTKETWSASESMSTIDNILSLTSSSAGYQLSWIDETYMMDTSQTSDYVTKLSTFYTPPHPGQYEFHLYGDDGAKLFVDSSEVVRSQKSWGVSARMTLHEDRSYYLEVLHYNGGGDAEIDLRIKHFNTTFTNAWTGRAVQEEQKITLSSTVVYEVQELTFTGFNSKASTNEVQQVVIQAPGDFRLGLYGVYTELISEDPDDTVVAAAMNKLPIFTSEESVTVVKELTSTPTFTITLETKRGDMPNIEVWSETQSYSVAQVSQTTKGSPDSDTVALSLGGAISEPFSVDALTAGKLSSTVNKMFEAKCPDVFESASKKKFYNSFESSAGTFHGSITKDVEPFCGRYSVKNPWKIYKTSDDELGISVAQYGTACFAHKGVMRDLIKLKYSYKEASTKETLSRYSNYVHQFQKDSDDMSDSWYYTCVDVNAHIMSSKPDDSNHRLEEILVYRGTDEDIYIDALFIGRENTTDDTDAHLLRQPPSMPNGAIIGEASVTADVSGSYVVTLKPLECGYDLPKFALANAQGSASMSVRRTFSASPPVTGFLDITFNGATKNRVNISLEAAEFKKELESLDGIGFVEVSKDGDCANFDMFVTFLTLPGDLPQMEVNDVNLVGIDAQATVTTLKTGGLVYGPLTGDMLQTVHETPQVRLYVNDVPVSCPAGDCDFTWDPAITVSVTSINPASGTIALGTILTISGNGFSAVTSENQVMIGGVDCPVTSATSASIECTVGNGPVGQHKVNVAVAAKGLATGSAMFEYTAGISNISPVSSGLGGGLPLTITGFGFKDSAVVTINSVECPLTSVLVDLIVCDIPVSTSAGSYDVVVTQGNATLSHTSFEYSDGETVLITTVSHTTVPVQGVTLTLTGSRFGSNEGTVTIGGRTVSVTSWSDTQVVIETGILGAGDSQVLVLADDGLAVTSAGVIPSLTVDLKVTNVHPLIGSVQGGTSLTIVGSGFGDNDTLVTVTVGDADCEIATITDTQITCKIMQAATVHYVTNRGIDYAYGEFYAFDQPNLNIQRGQYVDWSWETPDFVNNVYHGIRQVADVSSTTPVADGFNSGALTRNGRYRYQFTEVGTFYAWSGYIDEWSIKNYAGTINVVEAESSIAEVSVVVMGTEASHPDPAVTQALTDSSTCGSISSAIVGCSNQTASGGNSARFNFVFSTCSTPVFTAVDRHNGTTETEITITGEGFSIEPCQNEVTYGSHKCAVTTASETELVCSMESIGEPELGIYHPITVRVNNRGDAIPHMGTLMERGLAVLPNIQAVSPTQGSMAGGARLTITGFGFGDSQLVYVGGYSCNIVGYSYSEIICETPSSTTQSEEDILVHVMINGSPLVAACETTTRQCTYTYADVHTPIVTAVDPATVSGPTTLTINGTNFGNLTVDIEVTVGGVMASVMSAANTVIMATVQNLPAGTNEVVVRHHPKGLATGAALSVVGEQVISSVTPATGSIHGGVVLSIQGNGFVANDTEVLVDGSPCVIVATALDEVSCTAPAHAAGTVNVAVTSNGETYPTASFQYSTASTPTLTSLDPQEARSGTTLTIAGTSLGDSATSTVTLDGVPCVVTSASSTEIQCTLGDHATGAVDVSVFVDGLGESNTLSFEYELSVTSINPTTGGTAGGQTLTVSGTGFSASTTVSICGQTCPLTQHTPSSIQCRTSANTDQTCDVDVVENGLTRTLTSAYTYDGSLTPTVSDVTPRRGGTGGGVSLTITGSGFGTTEGDISVMIDGADCTVATVTDIEIVCSTGAHQGSVDAKVEVQRSANGIAEEVTSGDADFRYIDVWSSPYTWGGDVPPQAGELVVIPAGQMILLDTDTPVIKLLLIQGGQLIFDEKDVELNAEIIMITDGGLLQVGTEAAPFEHKAIITLHGHHRSRELPIYGTKVLAVRNGTLDLHGKEVPLTWTRLAATSAAGTSTLTLVDPVEWNVGDEIVIAASGHKHTQSENEKKTILAISGDKRTLTLDSALEAEHVGEEETFDGTLVEFRTEVGLLTHNVVVRGNSDPQWHDEIKACPAGFNTGEFAVQTCFLGRFGDEIGSSQFGGMILIHSPVKDTQEALARLSYIEVTFGGQAFRLGRYPVHFHLNGDMSESYVRGCGIHHTFNRAVNVHGSHNTMVEHNVIYNIMGGAFFLEDGIETGNTFQYNLAVFVRESSSLLNDDVTPASFWLTNPDNIVRHNAAAGGTHFGFWYRMHDHPDGPSFTTDVCCRKQPLGTFYNNSAHSFGWFGLWIFEDYFPLEGACAGGSPKPAVFNKLFSWNNDKGVEFVNFGAVQVNDSILVQNKNAGFEGKKVDLGSADRFTDDSPMVSNSLIVGRTSVIPNSQQGCTTSGIVLPYGYGFRVSNVRFVNFDASCDALSWTRIAGKCSLYCGGFTYHTDSLSFINSPNKVRYAWEWEGLILDQDGSLAGKTESGWWVVPTSDTLPHDCEPFAIRAGIDASVCPPRHKFHRLSFNTPIPKSLEGKDVRIINQYGNSTVPYAKKRITHPKGWTCALVDGEYYGLEFIDAEHLTNISYTGAFYEFQASDYLGLKVKVTKLPDRLTLDGGATFINASTALDPVNGAHGDWTWIQDDLTILFLISARNRARRSTGVDLDRSVKYSSFKCFYPDCIPPPDPDTVAPTERPLDPIYWNDTTLWNDTGDGYITSSKASSYGGFPQDFDNVKILFGDWVIIANATYLKYKFAEVLLEGTLELIDSPDAEFELNAELIIIMGGRLVVGWPDDPFDGLVNIILRGNHSSIVYPISDGPQVGAKAIGVFGGLDLFGQDTVSWTRLNTTVMPGDSQIALMEPVNWSVGDEIVVTATSFNAWETETFRISSIDSDNVTLTLNTSAQFRHIAHQETIAGQQVDLRAGVGRLTRNIRIIGEDYDQLYGQSFGARVIVGLNVIGQQTYTGYARLSNVEFYHTGQEGWTEEYDPRFSVAYVATGTVSDVKPSFVDKCSFHNGFNSAFGAFGIGSFNFTNNVVYNTVGHAVRSSSDDTRIINNLVTLNQWTGSYQERKETFNFRWEAGIDALNAKRLILQDNLVSGSERFGYHVAPLACDEPTPSNWYSNNHAYSSLIGVGILPIDSFGGSCGLFSGFTVWKNLFFGIYYQHSVSLEVSDSVIADNGQGIYGMVIGGNMDRRVKITDSLIIGSTSSFDCALDQTFTNNNTQLSMGNPKNAPSGGRIAIVSGTFTLGSNAAPEKPLSNIMTYNSIGGLTQLNGVTFAHFGENSCNGAYAVATMGGNDDGIHPTELTNVALVDVEEDYKVVIHRPNVGKINSADCVDMDCDGLKKAIFKDLDGTFLGAPGSVIPQSEFEWNGDSRRGLGDYRIPKEMVTRLDGSRIPYDTIAPNKGIYRGDNCTYMSAWNAYKCFSEDYELLIIESKDSDTETRRISPVAVLANGYIDLINGPQDHGWCSGYTCRKRLSTFFAVVATDLDYLVHFTGTTPKHMRYRLLDSDAADVIKLTVWYSRPNRLDVFVDDTFVMATNARIDNNGNYIISKPKGDEYRPTVANATGTNFMDIESGLLSIIIKGPQRIDVKTQDVILVSFGLPAMTEDTFFGENIIENLAAFLNIPLTKIRVVDIVSASSSRRRRSTSGISVTFEIGNEPSSSINGTVSNSIDQGQLLDIASYVVDECQAGNISESFNVTGSCESIEVPATSAAETQIVYNAENVDSLVLTEAMVVEYEGVPLRVQPKIQAKDPYGNIVAALGTLEHPWQLTASLRSGTGHPDAILSGTLTINSTDGWCNFTDLAISHMGTGYILDFNMTYPQVAENVTQETVAFDVPGRPIKGNVVAMTTGYITRDNQFTVTLDLRDENTDEIISDISWRSHIWHVTASLIGSPEYGSLTGTTTTTFDPVSGQAFFPDLAITGLGVYFIQFQVTSDPAGFNFTVHQKVEVIDPSHVTMVVEEQNEVQVKFDVDFSKVLQTDEDQYMFEQLVLGRFANTWSSVRLTTGALSEGSIVVTFVIDGSVADVNATAYSLCESISNSTDYTFNGYSLTLSPFMTINGTLFYGVSCGSIESSSSDDLLQPGAIAGISVAVLLLIILLIVIIVWRVLLKPKSRTHSSSDLKGDTDKVVKTKFVPNFLFREETLEKMKLNMKNSSPLPPIATGFKDNPSPVKSNGANGNNKQPVIQPSLQNTNLPPLRAPPKNLQTIFPGDNPSYINPTLDVPEDLPGNMLRLPSAEGPRPAAPQKESTSDGYSSGSSRSGSPSPYYNHYPFNERDSPMPPIDSQLYDGDYIRTPAPPLTPHIPTSSPLVPKKSPYLNVMPKLKR